MKNSYLTPINTILVIINILVFLISDITGLGADGVLTAGAMYPPAVLDGQWYRLITCTFLHADLNHIFNNMLMLVCLGSCLEQVLGRIKYLVFYILAGFGSSMVSMYWMLYSDDVAWSVGASGVVFAVIGSLLWIAIRDKGRFLNFTVTKFVIMIALSFYYGFMSVGVDNAAHVGGLVIGFLFGIMFYVRRTGSPACSGL